MMAIILAGGRGTRLKPFTMTIPKPLLPLGDMPIVEVVIRQLVKAGIERIVLTLGHMSHLFTASIGNGSRWDVSIEYCFEETPMGTAGPLHLVQNLDENFLVMNGDVLTTIDYTRLVRAHMENEAWGTIAVSRREVRIDFGLVKTTDSGLLQDYVEKPVIPYEVSMGINVLSRRCLEFIPTGKRFDMPQLMLAMQKAGKRVLCYKTDCYWQDIGRFEDYQRASEDFVTDPSRFLPNGQA